jgi:hypothetical protein
MNNILAQCMEETSPQFNPEVVNGIACKELPKAPQYLDSIIKSALSKSNITQLSYLGFRRLTPKEEFDSMFKTPTSKVVHDIAKTQAIKYEYKFQYDGHIINKILHIPYVSKGGVLYLSGTKYHVVPVLSDTVISPSDSEVFIRLMKDKVTIKRFPKNIILDGKIVESQVNYSELYYLGNRTIVDNLGKFFTPISLYLFTHYGIRESFKRLGFNPVFTVEDDLSEYKDMMVITTTGEKPKSHKDPHYRPHKMKIILPKEAKDNQSVMSLVTSLMYTIDILPEVVEDLLELYNSNNKQLEEKFWKIIIGKIVFKNSVSIDGIIGYMDVHIDMLDRYLDTLVIEKMSEIGIEINDFYELLEVVNERMNHWLLYNREHNSSLDNRYMDILYYLMYEIIPGLNRTIFDITRKSAKRVLTIDEVRYIFDNNIKARKIFNVISQNGMNLCISPLD